MRNLLLLLLIAVGAHQIYREQVKLEHAQASGRWADEAIAALAIEEPPMWQTEPAVECWTNWPAMDKIVDQGDTFTVNSTTGTVTCITGTLNGTTVNVEGSTYTVEGSTVFKTQ